MSDSDNSVMFEIGVTEHPATKSRIQALQKQVLDTQATITQGVERVGLAAQAVSSALTPLMNKASEFQKASIEGYDEMRGAINRLVAATENKIEIAVNVSGRTELESLMSQIRQVSSAGGAAKGTRNGSDTITAPDTKSIEKAFDDLPSHIRNVFDSIGPDVQAAADRIGEVFDKRLDGLANSQGVKNAFNSQLRSQIDSFASASRSFDQAINAKNETVERLNQNMVRASRSVLGAVRGFAELGLVSSESSEATLKGLAVIQGAFNIFDSAAEMLEAFTGGWKAVREATNASTAASKLQQTMMGPQFALMRAYQAQLALETGSADAATAANLRLAKSRSTGLPAGAGTGAAGVAKSVGTDVASQAVSAAAPVGVARAATGAASGGSAFFSTSVMGTTTGVLASVAAVGAALGALALVVVEAKDLISGNENNPKSVTDQIASAELGLVGSILTMTGTYKQINMLSSLFSADMSQLIQEVGGGIPVIGGLVQAFGFVGHAAMVAGGNIKNAKDAKAFATSKVRAEASEARSSLERDTVAESDVFDTKANIDLRRQSFEPAELRLNASAAKEAIIQAQAQKELAKSIEDLDRSKSGESSQREGIAAAANIEAQNAAVLQSMMRATMQAVSLKDDKIRSEAGIGARRSGAAEFLENKASKLRESGDVSSKELLAYEAEAASYREMAKEAYEKQKDLVKERNELEIQGQQRVGEMIKGQIGLKEQALQKSKAEQIGAARNFAKLGEFEKQEALDALNQARNKGAASLDDSQKDILRQVGTTEAIRFANEGDDAEAAKYGFNDQNFGQGFAKEQTELTLAKKKLEAELNTTYDVTVRSTTDIEAAVTSISDQVKSLMRAEQAAFNDKIATKLAEGYTEISASFDDKLRQISKNKQ